MDVEEPCLSTSVSSALMSIYQISTGLTFLIALVVLGERTIESKGRMQDKTSENTQGSFWKSVRNALERRLRTSGENTSAWV